MGSLLKGRLFAAWAALVAVTLISAGLGGWLASPAAVTAAVLAIAFAKAGLVMFEFMELRAAPVALQVLACGWLVVVLAVLLAVYLGVVGV